MGILASVRIVHDAVRKLENEGIEPECIVIGGLSQGGTIALASALTYPSRLGGAACLSGWLPHCVPVPEDLKAEELTICPVLWSHGRKDDCVLVELQDAGVSRLQAGRVGVTCFCDPDGGHVPGINQIMELRSIEHFEQLIEGFDGSIEHFDPMSG